MHSTNTKTNKFSDFSLLLIKDIFKKESHTALFKAAISISILALLIIQLFYNALMPEALSTKKLQYETEYSQQEKIKNIKELDCDISRKNYTECMLLKDKTELANLNTEAVITTLKIYLWLISFLLILSFSGFLATKINEASLSCKKP
nr:hypothetical protein [uncultured Halomonas sp.]